MATPGQRRSNCVGGMVVGMTVELVGGTVLPVRCVVARSGGAVVALTVPLTVTGAIVVVVFTGTGACATVGNKDKRALSLRSNT